MGKKKKVGKKKKGGVKHHAPRDQEYCGRGKFKKKRDAKKGRE